MHPYLKFVVMVSTSSVLMFGAMYLNTFDAQHVWFSETRLFMTMIMAGVMALVMFFFMRPMYRSRRANIAIAVGSLVLVAGGIALVRSQATVGDLAYMEAMIPHHSIAVLTSERAGIRDPRVRALADGIISTQKREIAEMESLIEDIREHGVRSDERN